MKLKLVTKVLTLCTKSEKLCERVFNSRSSCSFIFTWWTFVTFRTTQSYISCLFLALALPWHLRQPTSLTKGSASTDQMMLFQVTAASTAPSIL